MRMRTTRHPTAPEAASSSDTRRASSVLSDDVGPDPIDPGSPVGAATPVDAGARELEQRELDALAEALVRLESPPPPERSAALRARLEAEAGQLFAPPVAPGGGVHPRWLLWAGGALLLLGLTLWLARQATDRKLPEPPPPFGATERRPGEAGGDGSPAHPEGPASRTALGDVPADAPAPPRAPAPPASTAALAATSDASTSRSTAVVPSVPAARSPAAGAGSSGLTYPPPGQPAAFSRRSSFGVPATARAPAAEPAVPATADGILRGRVVDADGRPIAAAELTAYGVEPLGIFLQRTDDDGTFALRLPWGQYRLEVRAAGFVGQWYQAAADRDGAALFLWTADRPASEILFRLRASPASPPPVPSYPSPTPGG